MLAQKNIRARLDRAGVHRELEIIADGFWLQPPRKQSADNQTQRQGSELPRRESAIAPRRCGCRNGLRRRSRRDFRSRSRAIEQVFNRLKPAPRKIGNRRKQQRRGRSQGDHHARSFEIQAVRTHQEQPDQRSIHGVMPNQRRKNPPPQHHQPGDNSEQPDLDPANVRRLLGIVAVEKAPQKRRHDHRNPSRAGQPREKRNRKQTKRKFFVRGSQQPDRRSRNPRKERIHGFFVVQLLRRPSAEMLGHHVKRHHIPDVRGGERQSHNRRGEKFFRAQAAQRESLREPQTLRLRSPVQRLRRRQHQRDGQRRQQRKDDRHSNFR